MERYDLHIYFSERELVVSYGTQSEAIDAQQYLKAGKWFTVVDKVNNASFQVNGRAISYIEIKRVERP